MPAHKWLANVFASANRSVLHGKPRARPALESLETRDNPSTVTETEPNDTAATADVVTAGFGDILTTAASDWLTIEGTITSGNSDFFRFTIPVRSGVFLDVDAFETGLSTLDSTVAVLNSAGSSTLGSNDDGYDFEGFATPTNSTSDGTSPDPSLYLDLAAGTYVVRLSGVSNSTGAYQLRILADPNYLGSVPVLNSFAGATDTLYLDFNGHSATDTWGTYTATAFDLNGTAAEFSPGERLAIRNTWAAVSEDYAPFNINVTTVPLGTFSDGVAFRHVITNSDADIVDVDPGVLGVAFLDSYSDSSVNTAFTFAQNFDYFGADDSSTRIMAASLERGNTTSHEFGHALGLRHYSTVPGGNGNSTVIPNSIMASPDQGLNREVFGRGNADLDGTNTTPQDDLLVIGNATNAIGVRADDHLDTAALATVLTHQRNVYTSAGIITSTTDPDFFQFAGSGQTTIRIDVNDYVSNLDAAVRLRDSSGNVVALDDNATRFDAVITLPSLPQGTYTIEVFSNGEMGEVGRYTVRIDTIVDQLPVVTTSPGPVVFVADGPAVAIDTGVTVADADSPNLISATVSITDGFIAGQDVLALGNGGGLTGSYNPATGVLTITGSASPTAYQTALQSVTYNNTAINPNTTPGNRTITFTATDATSTSTATKTVAVVTPPVVAITPGAVVFAPGGLEVAIDAGVTVADADSPNLISATVSITDGFIVGQDVLALGNGGGLTGSYNPATGVLTITGSASPAAYQAALQSVTFNNNTANPTPSNRTVTFTVTDGTYTNTPASRTVTVDAVPVVTTSAGAVVFTAGGPEVVIDAGVTVADADNPNLTGATVRITGGFTATQDELLFTDGNGLTGSYNPATGVLTITGSASPAVYQTALQSVTFNTADIPNVNDRTITFTVTDGLAFSAPTTRTVSVFDVNDAPVNTVPTAPLVALEDNQLLLTGISIADVDAGGRAVAVALTASNGVILVAQVPGGLTANQIRGSTTATVILTGPLAAINTTLATAVFSPALDYNGPATVTVTTNDLGSSNGPAQIDTDVIDITVREANDSPIAGNDTLAATTGAFSIPFAVLIGNDGPGPADEAGQTLSVASVTSLSGGTVEIIGGSVVFTPSAGFVGTASFNYAVIDDGTTAGQSDTLLSPAGRVTFSIVPPPAPAAAVASSGRVDLASAIGLPVGQPAIAALFDTQSGGLRFMVNAFPGFTGGVTAAAADVNGDGNADLIVGTASGIGAVRVFDGLSGSLIREFVPMPAGLNVAAGDVTGDGFADIVVGTRSGPGLLAVFSGRDLSLVSVAVPFGSGGLQIGVGDQDGDGIKDVFAAPVGFPVFAAFRGPGLGFLGFGFPDAGLFG